jgi:hypothetical protein
MKKIETEITINANPVKVWNILTNFEKHREWNPFIRSIKGNKKVGEKLVISIQPPEGRGMTFKPVLISYSENREFKWRGKLVVDGIFDGEHYFILSAKPDGTTRLIHGEKFSGILVSLLGNLLDKTKEGFEAMNNSLKAECESLS